MDHENPNLIARFALAALAALAACAPIPALAVVPIPVATPALTHVAIDLGPGDQYDPHVSGDWMVYNSGLVLRTYNFSTGVNAQIPLGAAVRDLLPDVSGSRIVYSHIISGSKTAIVVFDASSPGTPPQELDPAPGTTRAGSAIGGNTVAYIDFGLIPNGALVIHDLGGSATVPFSFDNLPNQDPVVSPDGNVVTWEHCSAALQHCDIWRAVKLSGSWDVSVASAAHLTTARPHASNDWIAYDVLIHPTGSEMHTFWVPVSGAAEVDLRQAGLNSNPSIAGDFIAVERRLAIPDAADLFVYNRADNTIFRITDTPLVNEQLNDITVLPDGRVRLVWCSDEAGADQRNVRGVTFMPANPALPVPGLFNTGVNSDRYLLNPGDIDLHYTLVSSADPAFPGPNAIVASPIPVGYWVDNSTLSQWIAPTAPQGLRNGTPHPDGEYVFRQSFNLTGLNPAAVTVSGAWAADNTATLLLNGAATGNSVGGFSVLEPFLISTGFAPGINTLDFVVLNLPGEVINPLGLRVEDIGGIDRSNATLAVQQQGPNRSAPPLSLTPNPAHGVTTIGFVLAHAGRVELSVRDLAGRTIRTVASADYAAGRVDVAWNGRGEDGSAAPAGLYFVDMRSDRVRATQRFVLLR